MLEHHDSGAIRTLRLARPPVNALHVPMFETLGAAIRGAPAAGEHEAAGKLFSAGLDVAVLAGLDQAGLTAFLASFFECLRVMAECPLPMVAAINGHSPAGGAVLALFCDQRIMARGDFRIGLNEVQVGLLPGPLIYGVLKRAVSLRVANQMLPQGLLLTPEEALAAGLVDELAEPAELEGRAHAWLERVLALPPVAYRATRAMVRADLVALMAQGTRGDQAEMIEAWTGAETRASLAALMAKLGRR